MNIDDLRVMRRAEPFKPFRLHLDDGRKLPVERAAFWAISPTGADVAYALEEEGFEIIKANKIVAARVDETLHHEWAWRN